MYEVHMQLFKDCAVTWRKGRLFYARCLNLRERFDATSSKFNLNKSAFFRLKRSTVTMVTNDRREAISYYLARVTWREDRIPRGGYFQKIG